MLEPDLTAHNRCLGTPTRPVPRKSACSRYKLGLKLIHDPEARPLTSSSLVKLERLAAHLRANVRASLLLGLSSPLPNPFYPDPHPVALPVDPPERGTAAVRPLVHSLGAIAASLPNPSSTDV